MKKIFFGMMALVAMVATSCQQDVDLDQQVNLGETATVSFNLATPQIATKAEFSTGALATELQYAVYTEAGEFLTDLAKTDGVINGSTTVKFQLTTGNKYYVLFWAAHPDAPYTVDLAAKTMEVSYTGAVSSDETRDAFYYYNGFTVEAGMAPISAELKRPFAQLNIGTSDLTASTNAGYEVTQAKVTVPVYTNLDFASGEATNQKLVTFEYANVPTSYEFPVAGYKYLAMNYLLMNARQETVDVKFQYTDGTTPQAERTVGSVPVERNHRTNLYGQLITSDADVNVEINPDYEDDNKYGVEDGQTYVRVDSAEEFYTYFSDVNVDKIILNEDLVLSQLATRAADPALIIAKGKTLVLDLNGNKLSATSTQKGKNYDMIDVRGTLTVKNGTIEYKHVGENMGWGASICIFNITAGGVLNLEGVTAKNLGGSDMAFVAHLNNWGECTLNAENCTLESTYIAVRAFNSGYDMNNITIKNSTLKGKYCFWVHNYKGAGDAVGTDETLNLDILNGTNTFEYTSKAPILYGFANPIYYDAEGNRLALDQDTLAAALAEGVEYIVLANGEYELHSGLNFAANNITIVGASKEECVVKMEKQIRAKDGVTVLTLNNLTTDVPVGLGYSEHTFAWIHYLKEFNMIDCNSNGRIRLNSHKATIDGCTFDVTTKDGFDGYAIQYQGATNSNVVVKNSTFNTVGKAIVMYNEGQPVLNLDVEKCTFVSSASTDKAAVQMHTEYGISGTLNITDCTATGFAAVNGGLWNELNNNSKVPTNNFVVTVDGNVVKSTALIESEAAVDNAVVELPSGSYALPATYANGVTFKGGENTTLVMPEEISKNVTIEGVALQSSNGVRFNGNDITLTLNDCTAVNGAQRMSVGASTDKKVIELFDLATDVLDASRNNTLVLDGTKVNSKTTVIRTADELIAKTSISAGEVIILLADIDLAGKTFNGLDTFHPETNTTFDGMGYIVSNWTNESGASDFGFIKNWVGPIKNLVIKNAHLKTAGRSAIVAAKVYGDIKNCHVIDSTIEDSYWACGIIAGLYNSGSIYGCTVTGSSVKSNGGVGGIVGVLNESAGTRGCYKCSISNSTVHNTGIYGEPYSGALICGLINISNSTIEFEGCTYEGNTKNGSYVGDLYYSEEGNTVIVK